MCDRYNKIQSLWQKDAIISQKTFLVDLTFWLTIWWYAHFTAYLSPLWFLFYYSISQLVYNLTDIRENFNVRKRKLSKAWHVQFIKQSGHLALYYYGCWYQIGVGFTAIVSSTLIDFYIHVYRVDEWCVFVPSHVVRYLAFMSMNQ